MKKIERKGKQTLAVLLCVSMLLGGTMSFLQEPKEVQAEDTATEVASATPTYLYGSEWTRIGFEDFYKDETTPMASSGTKDFVAADTYGTAANKNITATYKDATSLNNTYFEGRVQSKGGAIFDYAGLKFKVVGDQLELDTSAISEASQTYTFEAKEEYRINTFNDMRFTLRISMKYHVDSDDDNNLDDLQVSVWVNDVMCGGDYIYITDVNWEAVTRTISIYNEDDSYSTAEYWSVKAVSDRPEDRYTRITFEDFIVKNYGTHNTGDSEFTLGTNAPENLKTGEAMPTGLYGLYARNANGNPSTIVGATYGTQKGISLTGTYFEGVVDFGSLLDGETARNSPRLEVGGFKLAILSNGTKFFDCTPGTGNTQKITLESKPADLGISSFADTALKLGISFTEVPDDADSISNLECKLWINDEFVYSCSIPDGCKTEADATKGILSLVDNLKISEVTNKRYIIIDSHRNEQEAMLKEQSKLKGYTRITLADFRIADGTYKKDSIAGESAVVTGYYGPTLQDNNCTLNKTYFETDITMNFEATNMTFRYAATTFRFGLNADQLQIREYKDSNSIKKISPTSVGLTTFKDTTFRLGIKTDYAKEEGAETGDVTFTIYINNRNAMELKYTGEKKFTAQCYIYDSAGTGENESMTVCSVYAPGEEPEKLTFADFGIADGTYDFDNRTKVATGALQNRNTFDGTIFEGKVGNAAGQFEICFGAMYIIVNETHGLRVRYIDETGTMQTPYQNKTYNTPKEDFKFRFSIKHSDTDKDFIEDTVIIKLYLDDCFMSKVMVHDSYFIDNFNSSMYIYTENDTTQLDITSVGYTDAPLKDLGDITDLNDTSLKKQVNDKDAEILRDVLLETKTLTEYQKSRANTNQVEPDEVIDIKDLIGLKKLMLAE